MQGNYCASQCRCGDIYHMLKIMPWIIHTRLFFVAVAPVYFVVFMPEMLMVYGHSVSVDNLPCEASLFGWRLQLVYDTLF